MLMEPVRDGELAVCAMARGDVTLDGVIDDDDLGAFLESWSAGDLIGADLNRDGRITAADMAIVLSAIDAASGNGKRQRQTKNGISVNMRRNWNRHWRGNHSWKPNLNWR